MREKLDAWVDSHVDEIIGRTQGVLRFPSVEDSATSGPGAPFGRAIADALEYTLALCGSLGMETENFDGYAGHATFGTGEEIVAMLGHLDVVPAGKDWTHDPWGAEIADGYIYSRGSCDDKGPTYAALFGAKAVLDTCKAEGIMLSRRIRLIFGTDEESGWQCMKHYFGDAAQPKPALAFTPDACFPLIYAEKGSFTGVANKTVGENDTAPLRITSFDSGLRPNMVPDEAVATIEGDILPLALAAETLKEAGLALTWNDPESLTVLAKGKSAHGSTPAEGINAAVKLLRILAEIELPPADLEWMADIAKRGADTTGTDVGIGGRDEVTGPLTCNMGILTFTNGVVSATFNVRYPATWDGNETIAKFTESLGETGWDVPPFGFTPPLYVPQDQEPVKTLLRVYQEQTGDMTPPFTIGGRTYATVVAPVGVAFGPSMPGDEEVAHQADERFPVARVIQCAKIYAQALYELAK